MREQRAVVGRWDSCQLAIRSCMLLGWFRVRVICWMSARTMSKQMEKKRSFTFLQMGFHSYVKLPDGTYQFYKRVKPVAYWAYETTTSFGAVPTMVLGISWFYLKLVLCFYVFPSTSLKWYPIVRQYAGWIVFNRLLSHRLLYIHTYIHIYIYLLIMLYTSIMWWFLYDHLEHFGVSVFQHINITYANYVPYVHVISIMLYSHHIQIWNPCYNLVFEWVPLQFNG